MKKLLVAVLPIFALLSACSVTEPVVGQFKSSSEFFLGEATGSLSGNGHLVIRSDKGIDCSGEFKYAASRVTGQGEFVCSDGRSGDFSFTSNGTSGEGFGRTTTGDVLRFRFGPRATARSLFSSTTGEQSESESDKDAATKRMWQCAERNISTVDDSVSDASTVAYALSNVCNSEYMALNEAIAQTTLTNDVQRRMFYDRISTSAMRSEIFTPYVLSYRASQRQNAKNNK